MSRSVANRQWLLRQRPHGQVALSDLELAVTPAPVPGEGELVVRVKLLCMDPTIRNFMDAAPGYGAPIALGSPIRGMIVGEVVASRDATHREGDLVWGFGSWSDYVSGPANRFFPVPIGLGHPLPVYTHVLGTIGLTARYGLVDVAGVRPGDRVLVSGAAGAVGSLVGQIARIAGATQVVGIAGGADKCARASGRYGYDECIDYKGPVPVREAIAAAFPEGLDVVFENVGGALLEAALDCLRKNARVALCGMIARYGATDQTPGPANLWNLVVNSARLQGFLVSDILGQPARVDAALRELDGWIRDDRLRYDIDLRTGFENIPATFNCLFTGAHNGRLVVQIDDSNQ